MLKAMNLGYFDAMIGHPFSSVLLRNGNITQKLSKKSDNFRKIRTEIYFRYHVYENLRYDISVMIFMNVHLSRTEHAYFTSYFHFLLHTFTSYFILSLHTSCFILPTFNGN